MCLLCSQISASPVFQNFILCMCVFSDFLPSEHGIRLHKSIAGVDVPYQQLVRLSKLQLAEHRFPYLAVDNFSCFPGLISSLGAESKLLGYDCTKKLQIPPPTCWPLTSNHSGFFSLSLCKKGLCFWLWALAWGGYTPHLRTGWVQDTWQPVIGGGMWSPCDKTWFWSESKEPVQMSSACIFLVSSNSRFLWFLAWLEAGDERMR